MKRGYNLIILIFVLILIPTVFAADNETTLFVESSDNVAISISDDSDILGESNDYYFNASADSDGNGSVESPYKYLNDRIRDNSNLYFADGEYNLTASENIREVNIIGSNVEKTIINIFSKQLGII